VKGLSRNAMNVVAVIPMIPGGLVAKAILGLFAIAATPPSAIRETIPTVLAHALRVAFLVFALGTGLAIPTVLMTLRMPEQGLLK
jgi:uncharacterized membrane protein YjjB (DUF3815 family)